MKCQFNLLPNAIFCILLIYLSLVNGYDEVLLANTTPASGSIYETTVQTNRNYNLLKNIYLQQVPDVLLQTT
jgi:hypothetical protein